MMCRLRFYIAVFVAILVGIPTLTTAFVAPSRNTVSLKKSQECSGIFSSTQLMERQWNFNEGQSPWGLKKNAEIWNGRVAQVAFFLIFFQELIQGKGVIKGIQEGDPVNLFLAGTTALAVFLLTGWLSVKGDSDYTKE